MATLYFEETEPFCRQTKHAKLMLMMGRLTPDLAPYEKTYGSTNRECFGKNTPEQYQGHTECITRGIEDILAACVDLPH